LKFASSSPRETADIFREYRILSGVAENIGRMYCGHDKAARENRVSGVELNASLRGRCDPTGAAHTLESSVSQEEYVSRANSPNFGIEVSSTSRPLTSLRRTVTRRSTLDHVSNVNSLGIKSGISELSIEDLTRPT
jgi:hypothetical protein